MRHVPSTLGFGSLTLKILGLGLGCGIVACGCSKNAPPPPKIVAPRPVAVAPEQPAAAADLATLRQSLAVAGDKNVRVLLIDDIAKLGQNAKPALDDLLTCATDADPRIRWHAVRAVGLIGEDALPGMPTLLTLLSDADPIVATQAAAAIGLIRQDDGREKIPDADATVYAGAAEQLIKSTTHPDARVRRAAVRAVQKLITAPEQVMPLISRQLADADPSVVMPALHTLADMDDAAVPFLLEALKNPKARYWASVALTEIGPAAAPAVEPLARLAAEGETTERMQALLALAAIGEQAAGAAPAMIKALESDDDALQFAAAFALGSVRAADADAALELAAKDDDAFLGEVAAWARARIHPADKPLLEEAVKRLRQGLRSDRPNERTAAAAGLSDLAEKLDEPARLELATEFADLLDDESTDVELSGGAALIRLGASSVETLRLSLTNPARQDKVLVILASLGPTAKPAVGDVIKLLSDSNPVTRQDAAVAIAAIGADAAAAVGELTKLLDDETAAGRAVLYPAAYALGRIGPAAKPAFEKLRTLAKSEDEMLATVAVWAAVKIEPGDASLFEMAIPALRQAIRGDREIVRLEAAVALGEIGPAAVAAIPILELVAEEDPVKAVRAAAAEALTRIKLQ